MRCSRLAAGRLTGEFDVYLRVSVSFLLPLQWIYHLAQHCPHSCCSQHYSEIAISSVKHQFLLCSPAFSVPIHQFIYRRAFFFIFFIFFNSKDQKEHARTAKQISAAISNTTTTQQKDTSPRQPRKFGSSCHPQPLPGITTAPSSPSPPGHQPDTAPNPFAPATSRCELEGGKKSSQPKHYRKLQTEKEPKRDGMKLITEETWKNNLFYEIRLQQDEEKLRGSPRKPGPVPSQWKNPPKVCFFPCCGASEQQQHYICRASAHS